MNASMMGHENIEDDQKMKKMDVQAVQAEIG